MHAFPRPSMSWWSAAGPSGATAAHDSPERGRSGAAARPGRAHQAVRRRDPAAPDPRFRHSRRPAGRPRQLGPHGLALGQQVDMPIDGGFVGMVDREHFDEWLRERAAAAGAERATRHVRAHRARRRRHRRRALRAAPSGRRAGSRARPHGDRRGRRHVRGGAPEVPGAERMPYVFAYHEIVRAPRGRRGRLRRRPRCDVYYQGHAVARLLRLGLPARRHRQRRHRLRRTRASRCATPSATCAHATGLDDSETIRREGAPIPLKPLHALGQGRDVVLAGDAAGVVAPASGEGIYYAMVGGRFAAEAVDRRSWHRRRAGAARTARKRFMKRARPRVLDPRHDAALLVLQRQAPRALRQHLPRPRRAAAHLGVPT